MLTLGVISSIAAEVVTWINKKVNGTVLQGDGAFFVAAAMSLVAATYHVWAMGAITDWHSLWMSFTQIWAVSQVFFLVIVQKIGLDVQPNQTPG
jgi:hypothetical protein